MDSDLMLVIGLVVCALSLPSIAGALSEGRAPRTASIAILVGGSLVVLALGRHPDGYAINEIPSVFLRVIGRFLH